MSTPEQAQATPENKPVPARDGDQVPAESAGSPLDAFAADIGAVAASPGQAAERARQLRQARGVELRFDGDTAARDVIGGNQYNFFTASGSVTNAMRVRLLETAELRNLRDTFVVPSGAPEPELLAERGLLVLRGVAGAGKTALATWLLYERTETVYLLDEDTRLDRIGENDLTGSAGYLLATLSETQAGSLTGFVANRLNTILCHTGARLILAVRPEVPFPDRDIDRYLVDVGLRPSNERVLHRHLCLHLGNVTTAAADRSRSAGELLGRADVRALLADELRDDDALSDVARMAVELAGAADRPDTAATVRQRLLVHNAERFRDWFEGIGELYPMCLAIALAVCQGLPYEAVADTALALHRTYRRGQDTAPTGAAPEPGVANPFGVMRDSRLHRLRAAVTSEEISTRYGPMLAEVARYRDPAFPERVLNHVWRQHDRARAGMVTWLRELGGHADEAVRLQAANVVGSLTTVAFRHLRNTVLESWAHSDDAWHNDSAAIALWPAVHHSNPSLLQAARTVVKEWSRGPRNARATAARAYGTTLGLVYPTEALAALDELAEDADRYVLGAVLQSLTDLAASDDCATEVLRLLVAWTSDRQRENLAELAFLRMSADLSGAPDDESTGTGQPTLPWLRGDSWQAMDSITTLWAAALNSADMAALALTVLDRWAAIAEPDAAARTALSGMLAATCVHRRIATRLRQRADEWSQPTTTTQAPNTARQLLALLPQKGHP